MKKLTFQFGLFYLDATDHLLVRDGRPVTLPPKTFDTLVYLVQHHGHLVTRDELIRAVWPNSFVEDGNLTVNISMLRRALADDDNYIQTVPRLGYRFTADVKVIEEQPIAAALSPVAGELADGAGFHDARAATGIGVGQERLPAFAPETPLKGSGMLRPKLAPRTWIWFSGVSLVLGAGLLIYWAVSRQPPRFAAMKIRRLTVRGGVADAALSPDGKYVFYFLNQTDGQSLWMRRVSVPGDIRVITEEPGEHSGLTFSPEGDYLFYLRAEEDARRTLYRMPVLGGPSVKILSGMTAAVSFSPDGKRLAFIRLDASRWQASLVVAKADGSELRTVLSRGRPSYISLRGLAWSADSRFVFCFAGDAVDYDSEAFRLVRVDVSSGSIRNVTARTWAWAGPIAREPDGKNLVVSASETTEDALQIWEVGASDGRVSRVTNDLADYASLSLSRDGTAIAAVQTDANADLTLASASDPGLPTATVASAIQAFNTVSWRPDGSIVYGGRAGDFPGIFETSLLRHDNRQLNLPSENETEPAVTRDGRYLIFDQHGKVWRANADGTNPRQLTDGAHDVHPSSSADGRYVVYTSFANWSPAIGGKPTVWRVSIDGGPPTELTHQATSLPEISPDGKLLAAAEYPGEDPRYSPSQLAVFDAEGGAPLHLYPRSNPSGDAVHWAPNGKALDYAATRNGATNLWRQSLDRGAPVQLTHFLSGRIFDFAWSPSGRDLVLARGKITSDVVLIQAAP